MMVENGPRNRIAKLRVTMRRAQYVCVQSMLQGNNDSEFHV